MNSPYGRRGSICAHFGWTWDYLHHGIGWPTVRRMLIDGPKMKSSKKDGEEGIKLTKNNVNKVASQINNMV